VNKIAGLLHKLSRKCDVIILRGNHDYLDATSPFFKWLGKIKNIRWVNEPMMINDDLYLPHTPNPERDWADIDMSVPRFIFTHNCFKDAVNEHGQFLPGISPSQFFPRAARVISGDVHVPQKLIDNVTYVGAPYHIKFGDLYQARFLLINEEGKVSSIKINGPDKHLITGRYERKHLTLDRYTVNKGDVVKVDCHISIDDRAKWWEIKEQIRVTLAAHGAKVLTVSPVVEYKGQKRIERVQGNSPKRDEDLMREYASARGIDDKTLEVGLTICNSTSSD